MPEYKRVPLNPFDQEKIYIYILIFLLAFLHFLWPWFMDWIFMCFYSYLNIFTLLTLFGLLGFQDWYIANILPWAHHIFFRFLFSFPFLFFKNKFLYLFVAELGLCCCAQAFSSCCEWDLLSSCGARASQFSGFSRCRAQALSMGFSSSGTQV